MMVARMAAYASRMWPCSQEGGYTTHAWSAEARDLGRPANGAPPQSATHVRLPRGQPALSFGVCLYQVPDALHLGEVQLAGLKCEPGELA